MRSQIFTTKLFFSLIVLLFLAFDASSQTLPSFANINWKSSSDAKVILIEKQSLIIEPSTNPTSETLNYNAYFDQYIKHLVKNLADEHDVLSSIERAASDSSDLFNALNIGQDDVTNGFYKLIELLKE